VFFSREQIAPDKAKTKKEQPDDETDPSLFQQSLQFEPAEFGPVGKISVHCLSTTRAESASAG